MADKRSGKLEKMNIIFSQALKGMGVGKEFFSHMVLFYWPRIVGKHISANVKPVKIEFKKLYLYSVHPVWATQLSYMEEEIIKKINNYMGEYLVEKIVFTNIPPARNREEKEEAVENIGNEIRKINITDQELKNIENKLSFIEDEKLRKIIYKVRINDEKFKKYRGEKKWHKCQKCDVLCPSDELLCVKCKREEKHKRLISIRKYLLDMPWARYCDVAKDIECTANEVNEEKIILMQKLAAIINPKNKDSFYMDLLTMLYKSVPPEKITEEMRESTIKKFRYDFNDGFKYMRKDRINNLKNRQ